MRSLTIEVTRPAAAIAGLVLLFADVLTEAFQAGELSYAVIDGTLPLTFTGRTCREI